MTFWSYTMSVKTKNSLLLTVAFLFIFRGCCSRELAPRNFLSDYTQLQPETHTSIKHLNPRQLQGYAKFMVDPVAVHFHSKTKNLNADAAEIQQLRQYLNSAILVAIRQSGNLLVNQSGPDVARLRIAITDIKLSSQALNTLPHLKLSGIRLGAASMEIELLDSLTSRQIGALVESQQSENLSLDGAAKWSNAKAVMDAWAERFKKRLIEIKIE